MRWGVLLMIAISAPASAAPLTVRCDEASTAELSIDGMLDDWKSDQVVARAGAIALRCSWDGTALAIAIDLADDRVVRVRGGKGHEDHVDVSIADGGAPLKATVYPGNAIAKDKIVAPAHVEVADSLQPKGFSIELRVAAARLPGFSPSTPSLALHVVFHDSDQATGGADTDFDLTATIELGDRKDLLDDFLKTVRLRRADVTLDQMADLDPDRRGKERLVAGGTVIGVLTDQFAYVSLPAAHAADVREVKLLPLGPHGLDVVSALVRQQGNGGSRDLLMLWTVWSGQLQPLAQIEVRKEQGANLLESTWKLAAGSLVVTPKPAVGWTADSWNEEPASDADPIALPWDTTKSGVAYTLHGHEVLRKDLPAPKRRR
jgi:hypothetical protein